MRIARLFSSAAAEDKQIHSLGQILEQRTAYLSRLDRRAKLERAAGLAADANAMLESEAEAPEIAASDFVKRASSTDELSLRHMVDAGLHLGHATPKWNPRMAPFVFGSRHGIHIVDLEKTLACLRQACSVIRELARREAVILFVGCRPGIKRLTYEAAMEARQYYVNTKWTGGTLTNAAHVLGSQLALYHSIGAPSASSSGADQYKPDCLVVLEGGATGRDGALAIAEAERVGIPTIGVCDTDSDPTLLTYPIPGNDDAFAGVELVARVLARSAREGLEMRHAEGTAGNAAIADSAMRFARDALRQLHPTLF